MYMPPFAFQRGMIAQGGGRGSLASGFPESPCEVNESWRDCGDSTETLLSYEHIHNSILLSMRQVEQPETATQTTNLLHFVKKKEIIFSN